MIKLYKKFQKTKRAVLDEAPLYDYTDSEIESVGYLKAINFNLVESFFAAAPAVIAAFILFLLVQPGMIDPNAIEGGSMAMYRFLIAQCIFFSIYLFIPPLFTGILAPFAGSGSVRIEDRCNEKKRRATRAYLYFDGSIGFVTQLIFCCCFILTTWLSMNESLAEAGIVTSVAILIAGLRQFYFSVRVIPKKLFQINGYTDRVRRFWQKKEADDPPWNRYSIYMIGGGIVTGFFVGIAISLLEKAVVYLMSIQ